jgi:hypothetical protein
LITSFNPCVTLWMSLLLVFHKIKVKVWKTLMNFKLLNSNNMNLLENKWESEQVEHREIIDHFQEIQVEAWEWVEWDSHQTALDLEVLTFCNSVIIQEIIPNEVQLQHTMALEELRNQLLRLMFGPNQECFSLSFQKWTKKVT